MLRWWNIVKNHSKNSELLRTKQLVDILYDNMIKFKQCSFLVTSLCWDRDIFSVLCATCIFNSYSLSVVLFNFWLSFFIKLLTLREQSSLWIFGKISEMKGLSAWRNCSLLWCILQFHITCYRETINLKKEFNGYMHLTKFC